MEEKKKLEVVTGDGSNLDISPVYDHLNDSITKTAEKKPKNIVIPKNNCKKDKKKEKGDSKNG